MIVKEIKVKDSELNILHSEIKDKVKQVNELQSANNTLSTGIENKGKEIVKLSNEMDNLKLDNYSVRCQNDKLNKIITNMEFQLNALRGQNFLLKDTLKDKDGKMVYLESGVRRLRKKLEHSQMEADKLQESINVLDKLFLQHQEDELAR